MENDRTIPDEMLDQAVYLNTRVTLRTRSKIDRFVSYMSRPESERPDETQDWPKTVTGLVETAVAEYLAKHPMRERRGPDKTPVRTTTKRKRRK